MAIFISKKSLLLFIALCCVMIFFYYIQSHRTQQQAEFDPAFATISGWAQTCFKAYPEYATPISADKEDYPKTVLPWGLLKSSINRCIDTFSNSAFYEKDRWIGGTIPPKDLLQLLPDNEMLRYIELSLADKHDEAAEIEREMRLIDVMHPFIQKLTLEPESKICFFGDIHSSIHSFLRSLLRLVITGFLNDDFSLAQPNHYIICDGDFGDLGRYGVEVLYTIMRLKQANMNQVFLLRGNHDKSTTRIENNLIYELKAKYPSQKTLNAITRIYRLLPAALYLGPCKDENDNDVFIQCCHGGVEIGFDPTPLLDASNKEKIFQKIESFDESMVQRLINIQALDKGVRRDNNIDGFVWSDFKQKLNGKIELNTDRQHGYFLDIDALQKFLHINPGVKAFFRAHQDKHYGLKLFFDQHTTISEEVLKNNPEYPNGPFHWIDVVSVDDQKNPDGFLVSKYGPVYTFSTAAEGRGLFCDCYGIFTTAKRYSDWRLKPYEFQLPENRDGRYVKIVFDIKAKNPHESIEAMFTVVPENNPLPAAFYKHITRNIGTHPELE